MKNFLLIALFATGCASTTQAPVAPKAAWEPPVQPEQEFSLTVAPDKDVQRVPTRHPAHNLSIPQSAPIKKSTAAQ